jgi:gas vesicle protein
MSEYDRFGEYSQQNQKSDDRDDRNDAVKYLLIGMGIGAGITLLLSPRSGTEIRRAIRHGLRSTFHGISAGTQNLRERGSNLLGFTRREFQKQTANR